MINLKPKSKEAFVLYLLMSVVIWQLSLSITKIFLNRAKLGHGADYALFCVQETFNKGAAYGFLENSTFLLGLFGVLVIIGSIFYVLKKISFQDRAQLSRMAVFTAGVLGNTAQRLFDGGVVDFIQLQIVHFPTFNIFDCLITVSIFGIFFELIKEDTKEGRHE